MELVRTESGGIKFFSASFCFTFSATALRSGSDKAIVQMLIFASSSEMEFRGKWHSRTTSRSAGTIKFFLSPSALSGLKKIDESRVCGENPCPTHFAVSEQFFLNGRIKMIDHPRIDVLDVQSEISARSRSGTSLIHSMNSGFILEPIGCASFVNVPSMSETTKAKRPPKSGRLFRKRRANAVKNPL